MREKQIAALKAKEKSEGKSPGFTIRRFFRSAKLNRPDETEVLDPTIIRSSMHIIKCRAASVPKGMSISECELKEPSLVGSNFSDPFILPPSPIYNDQAVVTQNSKEARTSFFKKAIS